MAERARLGGNGAGDLRTRVPVSDSVVDDLSRQNRMGTARGRDVLRGNIMTLNHLFV